MSLFAALFPPRQVRESLRAAIDGAGTEPDAGTTGGLRWQAQSRWHVTLGFYGAVAGGADERERADWLGSRLVGRPPVVLRVVGCGTFPGVLWAGVRGAGLRELAVAAGADFAGREYRPHLTLARWPRGQTPAGLGDRVRRLDGYAGPDWWSREVALVRSEPGGAGPRYVVLRRFPLDTAVRGRPASSSG